MDYGRDATGQEPATDKFQERKPKAEPCSLTRAHAEVPHRVDGGYRALRWRGRCRYIPARFWGCSRVKSSAATGEIPRIWGKIPTPHRSVNLEVDALAIDDTAYAAASSGRKCTCSGATDRLTRSPTATGW